MTCDTGVSCVLACNQYNEYDCGVIHAGNYRNTTLLRYSAFKERFFHIYVTILLNNINH